MPYENLLGAANDIAARSLYDIHIHMINKNNAEGGYQPNVKKANPAQSDIDEAACICDLNAYALMAMAAGVPRIEAMKAAVTRMSRANNAGSVLTDGPSGGKDRAVLLGRNSQEQFMDLMKAWADLPGHGAVQLKFRPTAPGPHTFVIERYPILVPPSNDAKIQGDMKRFRVHQAYQAVYRLRDFLDADQVDERTRFMSGTVDNDGKTNVDGTLWGYLQLDRLKNSKKTAKIWATLAKQFVPQIADAQTRFDNTVALIGGRRSLSKAELLLHVASPLQTMLTGALPADDYATLTGTAKHKKYNVHSTDWMIVLACDTVNPANFIAYDDLINQNLIDTMANYVELPALV